MPLIGDGPDAVAQLDWLGTVNTRTAFAYLSRDGFVDAVENGNIVAGSLMHDVGADRLDDIDRFAIHHRTTWQPIDMLTINYIFDKTQVRENPTATQLSFINPSDGDFVNTPEELAEMQIRAELSFRERHCYEHSCMPVVEEISRRLIDEESQ